MKLPKLAIIGRPNVGKSALFNRICKKRIAIVDEMEGVTRDRLYAEADLFGKPFELIDTGGIDTHSKAAYNASIRRQAEIAIEEADRLIMVVDGSVGPTLLDQEIARMIHGRGKAVTLAVNKIDDFHQLDQIHQFHCLGFKQIMGISAAHGLHVPELLEMALSGVNWSEVEIPKKKPIHVAIVGRPNVGKSTLVNYLVDEDRSVVSPEAGTTRDSIDVEIEVDGQRYILIDTAGIRRKKAEHDAVDKFAAIRTERAIERADICLLLLSAEDGITAQDKKIASQIEELGKGCILLFNKWDLVKGFRMEHCLEAVRNEAIFLSECPSLFTSATTGRNVDEIFPLIQQVYKGLNCRITTGQLNKFLEDAIQRYHPPMLQGKRLRIYFGTQVTVNPPRFVFFVNKRALMVDSYKKYLVNAFRKTYGFAGVPVNISLKGKPEREAGSTPSPESN